MRVTSSAAIGALTVVVGLALSGCASEETVSVTTPSGSTSSSVVRSASQTDGTVPDATTLVHDARSAYEAAKSAHVHATISQYGRTRVIDIHGTMDGSNQELTVDDSTQGKATVRTVDGSYYVQGDEDFWTYASRSHNATTGKLLAGKWVLAPGSASAEFKSLTIRNLLDDMLGPSAISDSDSAQMRTYRTTEQDTDLYAAVSTDDTQDVERLKVVASDPHNVTEVSGDSSDGSNGTADFDGWDAQGTVTAPDDYITVPNSADPTV